MMARLSGHYLQPGGSSRLLEDVGFACGLLLLTLRGLAEIAHEVAAALIELREHSHQFPWAFLMGCALLVAPKMVGRATAGRVWEAIGGGLAKLVSRGRSRGPGEPE